MQDQSCVKSQKHKKKDICKGKILPILHLLLAQYGNY